MKIPLFQISAKHLQRIVKDVGEEIHKNQHALNPLLSKVSNAPRDTPRMPTECMMQWITSVDAAANRATDRTQQHTLRGMLNDAKDQWLQHKLSFKDSREFFVKVKTDCIKKNLPDLTKLADQLESEIPSAVHDNFDVNKDDLKLETRLHDNIYGRVYDSAFIDSLVKNPPEGVKDSMHKVGNLVAEWFNPPNPRHIDSLQATIKNDHRGWEHQSPLLTAFVNEIEPNKKAAALDKFLRSPKDTGIDCIAIPYVAIKATLTDPRPKPSWRDAADANYGSVIGVQAKRVDNQKNVVNQMSQNGSLDMQKFDNDINAAWMNMDKQRRNTINTMITNGATQAQIDAENNIMLVRMQNENTKQNLIRNNLNTQLFKEINQANTMVKNSAPKTEDAGITMTHQPSAVNGMEAQMRPSTNYKPDFENNKLSPAIRTALNNGIAFAGGVSGSTNIMLHLVADANKNGAGIDSKDALLATTMFVTFDGGHSIHEPLWVANQLDGKGQGKLDLGLQLGDSSKPNEFISDYSKLFKDPLDSPASNDPMKAASENAFNITIAYFKENSFLL